MLWIWGSWCSWECLQREESGQSEVGWTTCAPGARRTLSMLLLLVFGGKGIYNKWC